MLALDSLIPAAGFAVSEVCRYFTGVEALKEPSANHQAGDQEMAAAVERTARRYQRFSRSGYYFVRGKLLHDVSTRMITNRAPLGDVIDLGCGRGQLDILLAESGVCSSVRGCDWDRCKIERAQAASAGLPCHFFCQDLREIPVIQRASADTVLMIDILHYLPPARQDELLAAACDWLRPGGRLLIRDTDAAKGMRWVITSIADRLAIFLGSYSAASVHYRPIAGEIVPVLESRGFNCQLIPASGRLPLANALLVAQRSGQ